MNAPAASLPVTRAAVRTAADHVQALGGGPGARIAIQVHPDAAGVATILGAALTGATISPLPPAWTVGETTRAISRLRPSLFIVSTDAEAPVGLPAEVRVVPVGRIGEGGGWSERVSGDAGLPTWILWSSGTAAGVPRGVVLSHGALQASARAIAGRLGLTPSDRWLCTLSPAHVGGLALLLRAVAVGSELWAPGRFETDRVVRALEEDGITHASLVPTQLRRVLESRGDRPPPATLRALLIGGAACPPELLETALSRGYPIALTWGMTEAASQLATAEPERVRRKPGTVGPLLPGVEIRIDPGDGPILGGGSPGGELLVRAPTLATGIFRSSDEAIQPIVDGDGWYRTGDLGRLDAEGDLWILGRASDLIITGGVNVSPSEVETALLRHPALREAAVVGVPDREWGERVAAILVLRPGAIEPSLEDLRAFLGDTLSGPKHPRSVRYVDALPRNANGKVDRARAARWADGKD